MKGYKEKLYLLVILFLLLLAACFWYARKKSWSERPLDIVLIQKAVDDTDFWSSISQGGEMAARELDVNLTVMGPETERDALLQNQMILEAIRQKPDAIALTPCSFDETAPYAEKIEEAGIVLVVVDSVMDRELGISLIATDNYEAGFKLGQYMRQFVEEDTVVGIVSYMKGTSTAKEREAGFRAGILEEERIAEVVFCDSSAEKAYDLTCALLEKYPDMDMIVGFNEYSAVGAARAVKELGQVGKIRMAGFDSSLEEAHLLEEGVFEAIVVQKPFNMGYLGIETAAKAARGKEVAAYVDSGSELITRENMYTEENQKLLFPVFGGGK